jgi:TRAP-type C4-dicarboxylate transport system substrate-binding protein
MNKDAWALLTPEIQKVLREEANATAERIQVKWNAEEAGVAQMVEEAGMTFIPPSEEFKAAVTKLLRPVWDEWAAKTKYGPEALKRALEALGRN